MDLIIRHGRRQFLFQTVATASAPIALPEGEPYVCLLWGSAPGGAWEEMQRLATCLITTDCRYAVCGGVNANEWEDAVDFAFESQHLQDTALEEKLVMTTSHKGESAEEVVSFFVHNTHFGKHDFTRFLVLQVGVNDLDRMRLLRAVRQEVARG